MVGSYSSPCCPFTAPRGTHGTIRSHHTCRPTARPSPRPLPPRTIAAMHASPRHSRRRCSRDHGAPHHTHRRSHPCTLACGQSQGVSARSTRCVCCGVEHACCGVRIEPQPSHPTQSPNAPPASRALRFPLWHSLSHRLLRVAGSHAPGNSCRPPTRVRNERLRLCAQLVRRAVASLALRSSAKLSPRRPQRTPHIRHPCPPPPYAGECYLPHWRCGASVTPTSRGVSTRMIFPPLGRCSEVDGVDSRAATHSLLPGRWLRHLSRARPAVRSSRPPPVSWAHSWVPCSLPSRKIRSSGPRSPRALPT